MSFSEPDPRQIRFWKPDIASVTGMLRVENEDRTKVTFAEHFTVVVIYQGAFDGWYRGKVRTHVAGALKLKEPGEVHRDLEVYEPFTLQGVGFAPALVAAVADAMGLRGSPCFRAPGFGPSAHASKLGVAMHEALVRESASAIERETLIAELLGEVLGTSSAPVKRAPRAVRRARAFLEDTLAAKVTLDDLAAHAGLDKFHLVRAFRAEVGLPPYQYLTHLRIARARELLRNGIRPAEAAQAVGLYDESQLHRHFKRIVGVAPGAYARCFSRSKEPPTSPKTCVPRRRILAA